jgi:hypothetical protein
MTECIKNPSNGTLDRHSPPLGVGRATRRKTLYYQTTSSTWSSRVLAYTAARDAACWQLERMEAEVWRLLEGIESIVEDLRSMQVA